MKKLLALSAIVVLVVFLVSACTLTISTTATVSGTIHFTNMSASNASVTIQQGSSAYGMFVILSGGSNQSGSYALYNVPFGTYTVYVAFNTPYYTYHNASYYINGAGPYTFVPGGSTPNWTETIVAVPVNADTTVDTYLTF